MMTSMRCNASPSLRYTTGWMSTEGSYDSIRFTPPLFSPGVAAAAFDEAQALLQPTHRVLLLLLLLLLLHLLFLLRLVDDPLRRRLLLGGLAAVPRRPRGRAEIAPRAPQLSHVRSSTSVLHSTISRVSKPLKTPQKSASVAASAASALISSLVSPYTSDRCGTYGSRRSRFPAPGRTRAPAAACAAASVSVGSMRRYTHWWYPRPGRDVLRAQRRDAVRERRAGRDERGRERRGSRARVRLGAAESARERDVRARTTGTRASTRPDRR